MMKSSVPLVSKVRNNPFDTTHLGAQLDQRTVRGGVTTIGAQFFRLTITLVSVAIMARLLTPADFGLVAMVTALTGIVGIFKDAGLSAATVQRLTVSHEQASTLFWLNVGLGTALMLLVVAIAPLVASFYGDPRLLPITLAISGLFLVDGLAVQHQALLRRQMRFGALAKIQIVSALIGLVVAVAAAIHGAGYWALVVQLVVAQVVTAILSWAYERWRPGRPRRGVGSRAMVQFGAFLTGFNFVNYFARNADNILIGKVWGEGQLGLYSKAYSLLLLPLAQFNGPITAVALPALSRLQDEPDRFRDLFRKVLGVIAFLTFPLVAWMIVCRREIVLLLLGPQWEGAIPIFAVLALSAFVQPFGNISGLLYTALGRTRRMFHWGLIGCSWLVLSFFVGIPFGAIGVAFAYSIAMLLMALPLVLYAISGTQVTLRDYFDGIKYPLISTVLMILIGFIVNQTLIDVSLLMSLVFTSIVMFASYVISLYLLNPLAIRHAIALVLNRQSQFA